MKRLQPEVWRWVRMVLGEEAASECAGSVARRLEIFLEEAVELAQALGVRRDSVVSIVANVYGRPRGTPLQELGGTATTLCALASALGVDLESVGKVELERMWSPEVIQRVQERAQKGGAH